MSFPLVFCSFLEQPSQTRDWTSSAHKDRKKKPGGFAIAQFPGEDETFITELPNLMLEPVVLKSPAEKVLKRPAMKKPAAPIPDEESLEDCEENEEEQLEDDDPPVQDGASTYWPANPNSEAPGGYNLMWYKEPRNAWAVRRKFLDKKQIFQCKFQSREEGRQLFEEALDKLNSGMCEDVVKQWVLEQASNK